MGFIFSSPVLELAILIVVAVGKAVYKLYKYFTKKEKLCKASKDIKVSENASLNQTDMEKMVTKWEPLNISQAELKNVQALTNSLFEKKV